MSARPAVGRWLLCVGCLAAAGCDGLSRPDRGRWDAYQAELSAAIERELARDEDFALLSLSTSALQQVAQCTAAETIAFLNTTPCHYRYVKLLTSEQAHLKEQQACLARTGLPAQQKKATVRCVATATGNSWTALRGPFAQGARQELREEIPDAERRARVADCYADKMVEALQQSGDGPYDLQADSAQAMLKPLAEADRLLAATGFQARAATCLAAEELAQELTVQPTDARSRSAQRTTRQVPGFLPAVAGRCPAGYRPAPTRNNRDPDADNTPRICSHKKLGELEPSVFRAALADYARGGPPPRVSLPAL